MASSSFLLLVAVSCPLTTLAQLRPAQAWSLPSKPKRAFDYDLVVIGAGASGLFAAGTASSVGFRTLLIERAEDDEASNLNVGGDCTNAACVPSKAVQSIARMSSTASRNDQALSNSGDHANNESDVTLHERRISSKKFLIATGASPVLQDNLVQSANRADVPFFTCRSLLRPSNGVESLLNLTSIDGSIRNIVLVGGGATACELGQAMCRLGGGDLNVTIVAPAVIPTEDVSLQKSVIKILQRDGCNLHLGARAVASKKARIGWLCSIIIAPYLWTVSHFAWADLQTTH